MTNVVSLSSSPASGVILEDEELIHQPHQLPQSSSAPNNGSLLLENDDEANNTEPTPAVDDDDDRRDDNDHENDDDAVSLAPSVATTMLATEVGSVVGAPKDAFLRSLTFLKNPELEWTLEFADPPRTSNNNQRKSRNLLLRARRNSSNNNSKDPKLSLSSLGGGITGLSRLQPGDLLKSINGKRIGPSFTAARANALLQESYDAQGVLSVSVTNPAGSDVLVQATILKPSPTHTCQKLGLTVWYWGVLCIKEIARDSIFAHTVLKETDEIISINDIDCTDRMTPEQFAHIVQELPLEITIEVRRGKDRWSGRFG